MTTMTNSACRHVPVFWNTALSWVRTVPYVIPSALAAHRSESPATRRRTMRASAGVKSNRHLRNAAWGIPAPSMGLIRASIVARSDRTDGEMGAMLNGWIPSASGTSYSIRLRTVCGRGFAHASAGDVHYAFSCNSHDRYRQAQVPPRSWAWAATHSTQVPPDK